ncbi:Aste57867_17462 [Aphanomyces stellatus]|uniref:Aste57867_17462 protein n=1 Tax=Aphanomyces stellatus TaxID=120398 RepID=A0A485L7Y9_9STRA|nr:hypothetical protein As57867_017402 [Aphanomyces stellatus]VFT94216.1 Aste57867_17462 [Aphanomyces stellatus]
MEIAAASKFGQKLAHTDKHVRDKAVKSLTLYLVKKKEWSDLDLDKIWKALFYCMWMSDKLKIQNELAENLSKLVHAFPDSDLKMRFLHSFFKTIHREWHGIDGLRLDKFYSLIRKMLFQSFQVLQSEWDQAEAFATHISGEILSKLPNGLRLHMCDVYLEELHKSIGATVESDNLVMLLEPFFTLISSETDKIVTKRVNDMVFQSMLNTYQFQDTLKEDAATTDSEDGDDDTPEAKVFGAAHLADVQHRVFELAAAAETQDRNRNILYSIYSAYFGATKVDSAKQTKKRPAPTSPVDEGKKKKAKKTVDPIDADEKSPKKTKQVDEKAKVVVADDEKSPKKAAKATKQAQEEDKSPKKAAKVVKQAQEEGKSPKKADKVAKSKEEAPKKATKKAEVTEVEEKSPKKVNKEAEKKSKALEKAVEADVAPKKTAKKDKKAAAAAPTTQKEKATPYPRCTSCGGFGKGLIAVNKSMCAHCERAAKKAAKAQASNDKKRKAAAAAAAEVSEAVLQEASKKVRFGTNKALPYELSMKRMKKSVEKELVKPATGKGVLKVKEVIATATSNVKKNTTLNVKRARAADFF